MKKKRFLRDNVLDMMLEEIHLIAGKSPEGNYPGMFFSQSLFSLGELYETNKLVLIHLEEVIDRMRRDRINQGIVEQVAAAAAHIQLGLVTVHTALKKDTQAMLEGIEHLRKCLDIT